MFYKKNEHERIEAFSHSSYAEDRRDRKPTSGCYIYVGGNLVIWKSKKQTVVSLSSTKTEYRAMAHTACEMIWLKTSLGELDFCEGGPMSIYCDIQRDV